MSLDILDLIISISYLTRTPSSEESTMISGHILVEPLSDVIPVIVASKWILEALV